MEIAGALELHYYLKDDRHFMDAALRNQCELELLALFREVSAVLGIPIALEAQALREGGLRDIWRVAGQNAPQLTLLGMIVTILLSIAPLVHQSDASKLSEQLTELQIEKTKLEIEKLKKQVQDLQTNTESTVKHNAIDLLRNDPKIVVRRSNFYKQLSPYGIVTQIGIIPYNTLLEPIQSEVVVPRTKFSQFVLVSQALKPETVEDASIQLVSPVLREGNFKWKGIYNKQAINFSMQDSIFRNQVLREPITFQHGTVLECVLDVHRKLNEVGEIEITGYAVKTVIRKLDETQSIETPQGREYKQAKRLKESQGDMFTGDSN